MEVTGVTTAEVTITVEVTAAEIKAVKTTGVAEAEVTAEAKAAATTVAAVKEVMVVVAVAMAGADTIMVATMVSMEDSRVMATTSEAVEAAAGVSEPVVKAAAEAIGGIKIK